MLYESIVLSCLSESERKPGEVGEKSLYFRELGFMSFSSMCLLSGIKEYLKLK